MFDSCVPIRGSNRPLSTGVLLLMYVSLVRISTTEFLRISSGDITLNCKPMIRDGFSFIAISCSIVTTSGVTIM